MSGLRHWRSPENCFNRSILLAIFITAFFAMAISSASARVFKKMDVPQELETQMNELLKAGSDLHRACSATKDDQIDRKLDSLSKAIDETRKQTRTTGAEKTHIDRILIVTQSQAAKARKTNGEARSEALAQTFKYLVQIEQEFQLDKYNVFFCGQDKAVWIQKESKPINPIHPTTLKTCGKQVQ